MSKPIQALYSLMPGVGGGKQPPSMPPPPPGTLAAFVAENAVASDEHDGPPVVDVDARAQFCQCAPCVGVGLWEDNPQPEIQPHQLGVYATKPIDDANPFVMWFTGYYSFEYRADQLGKLSPPMSRMIDDYSIALRCKIASSSAGGVGTVRYTTQTTVDTSHKLVVLPRMVLDAQSLIQRRPYGGDRPQEAHIAFDPSAICDVAFGLNHASSDDHTCNCEVVEVMVVTLDGAGQPCYALALAVCKRQGFVINAGDELRIDYKYRPTSESASCSRSGGRKRMDGSPITFGSPSVKHASTSTDTIQQMCLMGNKITNWWRIACGKTQQDFIPPEWCSPPVVSEQASPMRQYLRFNMQHQSLGQHVLFATPAFYATLGNMQLKRTRSVSANKAGDRVMDLQRTDANLWLALHTLVTYTSPSLQQTIKFLAEASIPCQQLYPYNSQQQVSIVNAFNEQLSKAISTTPVLIHSNPKKAARHTALVNFAAQNDSESDSDELNFEDGVNSPSKVATPSKDSSPQKAAKPGSPERLLSANSVHNDATSTVELMDTAATNSETNSETTHSTITDVSEKESATKVLETIFDNASVEEWAEFEDMADQLIRSEFGDAFDHAQTLDQVNIPSNPSVMSRPMPCM